LLHTEDIYPISEEFMGVAKKAKVTFTCEPSLREGLEAWAESESRTLSNLVELLIRQAYEAHQELAPELPEPKKNAATRQGRGKSKGE
jgi:hypothetical protein